MLQPQVKIFQRSYRTFYEGAAWYVAVPVNFFLVSEADKALTMAGWGERKMWHEKKEWKWEGGL